LKIEQTSGETKMKREPEIFAEVKEKPLAMPDY